jgi:hypothetical protein
MKVTEGREHRRWETTLEKRRERKEGVGNDDRTDKDKTNEKAISEEGRR